MKTTTLLSTLFVSLLATLSMAQNTTLDIRLNQVGYLPNSKKLAALINTQSEGFTVADANSGTVVYEGDCLPAAYYSASDENVSIADFSMLTTPGEYVLMVEDLGKSVPFVISDSVFTALSKASIKALYFNRASMPIESAYGGIYARKAGHPDTAVVVHPSAASTQRPAGTKLSTPMGWYDAGDYNKYIVNSGISTFTLLSAYETYPSFYDTLDLNIPESGNNIPDILDEALYNIKWMMTMQDTNDGGVYHKTTEASFSTFAMPDKVTATRYVCAKGTAAALDFAAIMAMTARIYKKYDPTLAAQALQQAEKAYQWAKSNPNKAFTNPKASGGYPAISTGEYGDSNFGDEFSWAAAELYITSKNETYYSQINLNQNYDLPGWGNVKTLGLLSLLVHKDSLTTVADTTMAKNKLTALADNASNTIVTSPYRICGDFFYWGGNNAYANWGMLFLQAFNQTKNATYFNAALSSLDYMLGRNATTYCFVTGTGTKNPKDIHHRPSGSDGIAEPIPGFLAGGPNPGNMTDCGASQYPSSLPAKAYYDKSCSYSTNEIAINWNAPLAFLAGALQSAYLTNFTDSMPPYFSVSAKTINLPADAGYQAQLVIETNTAWKLTSADNWIGISSAEGTGSTVVYVSSNTDNTSEASREGKIYIYNLDQLTDSIVVTQNGVRKNFRLEAEDYSGMLGLQTETTTDTGGGMNLGYVDPGDWATYNLDISFGGVYNVTFRHAGYAGSFDVSLNDVFLQNVSFDATADWQVWADYTTQMAIPQGQHVMKLDFKKAGTNLNYYDFKWDREVSVSQDFLGAGIHFYPNPVEQYLNIEFAANENQIDLQLWSLDGKQLVHQTYQNTAKASLDFRAIQKGSYILKINNGSTTYAKTIMIQ